MAAAAPIQLNVTLQLKDGGIVSGNAQYKAIRFALVEEEDKYVLKMKASGLCNLDAPYGELDDRFYLSTTPPEELNVTDWHCKTPLRDMRYSWGMDVVKRHQAELLTWMFVLGPRPHGYRQVMHADMALENLANLLTPRLW